MSRDGDDDRPRKSWRDLDRQRDRSTHRREERPAGAGGKPLDRSQAYRAYKSQLDKLFDGGALPDALRDKLAEAGVGADAKRKKEALERLLSAADLKAELETYAAAFGFPEDEAALARLLDLGDERIALDALRTIARLRDEGRVKRGASFKARIRTAQMTIDSPALHALARELLDKL